MLFEKFGDLGFANRCFLKCERLKVLFLGSGFEVLRRAVLRPWFVCQAVDWALKDKFPASFHLRPDRFFKVLDQCLSSRLFERLCLEQGQYLFCYFCRSMDFEGGMSD